MRLVEKKPQELTNMLKVFSSFYIPTIVVNTRGLGVKAKEYDVFEFNNIEFKMVYNGKSQNCWYE